MANSSRVSCSCRCTGIHKMHRSCLLIFIGGCSRSARGAFTWIIVQSERNRFLFPDFVQGFQTVVALLFSDLLEELIDSNIRLADIQQGTKQQAVLTVAILQ